MDAYKENRFKKIRKSSISFLLFMIAITLFFKNFDLTEKSYFDFLIYYSLGIVSLGIVSLCLSSRKICLEFNDKEQTLMVYKAHILGGGIQQIISYNNLSFKENYPDFLSFVLQKSDLILYDSKGKKVEIKSLDDINDSQMLLKKLETICKKSFDFQTNH